MLVVKPAEHEGDNAKVGADDGGGGSDDGRGAAAAAMAGRRVREWEG